MCSLWAELSIVQRGNRGTQADMSGGRHYCFITFFARNALLLLGVLTHAVGSYSCEQQYGRVGESILLSPGSISEKLSKWNWKFNEIKVAEKNINISGHQFTGRLSLENYNLTIRELKTTDSGDFTFISSGGTGQRQTICIRLSVQEVLTAPPRLNITKPSNDSCVVLMGCSSKYDKDVSYSWTVNNERTKGPTLQYQLKPQDGDTTFTCTVSNMVSNTSVSEKVNCQSTPSPPSPPLSPASPPPVGLIGILIIAGVICAVLVSIVSFVVVCRYKKAQAAEAIDELTVYAEIDDVKIMKPCSVYETLEQKATTVKPQPQTVYDQIQFHRMQ